MARMSPLAVSTTVLLFLLCLPSASRAVSQPKPRAVKLPVRKDAVTGQYLTTFRQRTPLVTVTAVLDLANPTTWVDCEKGYVSSTYRGVHCASKQCRLTGNASCDRKCSGKPGPSCLNSTCIGLPENSVTREGTAADLLTDVLVLPTTSGPGGSPAGPFATAPEFLFSCSPAFLTEGLAAGATGMASLSRNRFALPTQLAATFGFSRRFALCLPSSSAAPSVVVIGDAPHTFQRGADLSNSLAYTPLLVNPYKFSPFYAEKSDEYFIGVTGIKVNGRAVPLNATRLAIDGKGSGGTKLNPSQRYTVMETSTYKAVTAAFAAATAGIPRAPPVAPFKLCYDGSKVGRTRVGPAVPNIELVLGNKQGTSWVVFGANSMVAVKGGALCLGVVDGGEFQMAAIELGGNMLEDNLLEFDLEKSRLGFSSSLLFRQTTCSNFHLG